MGVRSTPGRVHPPTRTIAIRLAIGVVGGGSEARYTGVGNLQREWGGAGRLLSGGGKPA